MRGASSTRSYEILRKEGPFAILPMGSDLFQIVWSSSLPKSKTRLQSKPSELLDELASILPDEIQPDTIVDTPKMFPVSLGITFNFFNLKYVLVGESAHNCHPVGGQGLNLCLRDTIVFTRLIQSFNGKRYFLNLLPIAYSLLRLIDISIITLITDLLVRIFSNSNPFLLLMRSLILSLINRFSFLRKLILYIMSSGLQIL